LVITGTKTSPLESNLKENFFMGRTRELEWQIEEFMIYCKSKDLRGKTAVVEIAYLDLNKDNIRNIIAKGIKRITQINDYIASIEPKKYMLFVPHINKPNMVAQVASVLGTDNINISGMQVAQNNVETDKNVMVINVDSLVENTTLDKIAKIDGVDKAKFISL
jgi:predicted regulator of amino acid metabolism with ACT domain